MSKPQCKRHFYFSPRGAHFICFCGNCIDGVEELQSPVESQLVMTVVFKGAAVGTVVSVTS